MIYRISEILEQIDEKERKEIEKLFDRCINEAGCNIIDWKNFGVVSEAKEYVKRMLQKYEATYILSVAISIMEEVIVKKGVQDSVEISIIKNSKNSLDSVDFIRVNCSTIIAIITLSRKSRYYLDSED